MEVTPSVVLLDHLLQPKDMSFSHTEKYAVVQRYVSEIKEISESFEPVIGAIASSQITLDGVLEDLLIEINTLMNEIIMFLDGWNPLTSKLHSVLKIESLLTKVRASIFLVCRQLRTLFHSPELVSLYECVQQCMDKFEPKSYGETTDIINSAISDQVSRGSPGSKYLEEIAKSVGLVYNMDLLMELASLKLLKNEIVESKDHRDATCIDELINLVEYMQNCFAKAHQLRNVNDVPVPIDICCPLSLRMMSDPVIVASGQTYERTFIKNWLDRGFTLCPRTWQKLGHTNLIPNYTVKALIANWCEMNEVNLPEFLNLDLNCSSDFPLYDRCNTDHLDSSVSSSHEAYQNAFTYLSSRSLTNDSFPLDGVQGKIQSPSNKHLHEKVGDNTEREDLSHGNGKIQTVMQNASSSMDLSNDPLRRDEGDLTPSINAAADEANQQKEDLCSAHVEASLNSVENQQQSQRAWQSHASTSRSTPNYHTSSEAKPLSSELDSKVYKLIGDVQSSSIDIQVAATLELRLLTRKSVENRIIVAECGAVDHLMPLLYSSDLSVQENAVTALMNLSLNTNNKAIITNTDFIHPLVHVLKTGSQEAKANAAACFYSLSVTEEIKVRIGKSEAIGSLVELLSSGTPQAKKDAATALFNLSLLHENRTSIVQAGAVSALVNLMDPALGVVDKAVAVLANLSSTAEGRHAIGRGGGIPALVEAIELGSSRGKENAAAALLHLCMDNNHGSKFCYMALQADAVPPVKLLTNTGTARAKEKANTLLNYFKNERRRRAARR